jgi:hypothetical protein
MAPRRHAEEKIKSRKKSTNAVRPARKARHHPLAPLTCPTQLINQFLTFACHPHRVQFKFKQKEEEERED